MPEVILDPDGYLGDARSEKQDSNGIALPRFARRRWGDLRFQHPPPVEALFAPTRGDQVLSAGGTSIRVFDREWGVPRRVLRLERPLRSASLSDDRSWLAFALERERGARLWNRRRDEFSRIGEDLGLLWAVALAPGEPRLVASHGDGNLTVISVPHGRRLQRFDTGPRICTLLSVSPDGRILGAAGRRNYATSMELHVRDLTSGAALSAEEGPSVREFAPDKYELRWPDDPRSSLVRPDLSGVTIDSLAISPSGGWVATPQVIWAPETGKELPLAATPGGLLAQSFDREGRTLHQLLLNGDVLLRGVDGTEHHLEGVASCPQVADFSADGTRAVLGCGPGRVQDVLLYELPGWRALRKVSDEVLGAPTLALSPDGKWMMVSQEGGHLSRWDLETGAPLWGRRDLTNGVSALAFTPDSALLAIGSQFDDSVRIFDMTTDQVVESFPVGTTMSANLALHPRGHVLAVACKDWTIRLFDLRTLREAGALTGHLDAVTALEFDRCGELLVSASRDGTLLAWDVPRAFESMRLG